MLKAEDIMTKEVITVSPEVTVEKAAKILSENNISGVPVVDNGELKGIISEKDLIVKDKKLHFPDYIPFLDGIIYLDNYKKFEKEFKKFIAVNVEDLMTEDVVTISPDTPVDEIATLMVEKEVNRIPVVEEGKIAGIVTRADLVRDLASI